MPEDLGLEATVTSEPGQEPAATETPAPTPDPFEDAKVESFDRNYVEKLRGESAKYRTRAQEAETKAEKFAKAFEGHDENTVEGFLGLAQAYVADPDTALPVLQQLMEALTPAEQAALTEAIDDAETTKGLTPEEVEAKVQEALEKRDADRAAKTLEDENFNKLKTEITGLGYDLDETNPNPDTALLFFFAGQQPADQPKDFKKAHEAVEAFRQANINQFKEGVRLTNSRFNRPVTGATPSGADGGKQKLKLGDGSAAKAFREKLDASFDA